VLLGDPSHRDDSSIRVRDRHAEHTLALEDSLGMMPQSPVPEVSVHLFGTIEEAVNSEIAVLVAAKAFR
jgi:hypothetical protein